MEHTYISIITIKTKYRFSYNFMSYFHRQERDLYSRKDQFGVELRERAKWDLREAMVGTETFLPKHVVIATWKNVTFAGGIPQARRIVRFYFHNMSQNTFSSD